MRTGNSHKHINSKDSKAMLGICVLLNKGEKGGNRAFNFRSENKKLTRRSGRAGHSGGRILAWGLSNNGTQGYAAHRPLPEASFFTVLNSS